MATMGKLRDVIQMIPRVLGRMLLKAYGPEEGEEKFVLRHSESSTKAIINTLIA